MTSTYKSTARIPGIPGFNEGTWKDMSRYGAARVQPWQLVKMLGEIWLADQV